MPDQTSTATDTPYGPASGGAPSSHPHLSARSLEERTENMGGEGPSSGPPSRGKRWGRAIIYIIAVLALSVGFCYLFGSKKYLISFAACAFVIDFLIINKPFLKKDIGRISERAKKYIFIFHMVVLIIIVFSATISLFKNHFSRQSFFDLLPVLLLSVFSFFLCRFCIKNNPNFFDYEREIAVIATLFGAVALLIDILG
ncbi:hypothetical protein [Neokomagataea anthophila]|uniref:Uncharacterized protein n=1 Tax=Neokomagataea anthophila TaxID=2826925 RepID=A0ABS5E856_9PROT|nr:hypothetical protein [Neokomagataea anthophila]MBR0560061.1 hypothetical protein [Neokomagataea anthophila]